MRATFIVGAAMAALASGQEPQTETVADLDKHARESLQKKVAVLKGLTLPLMFYMLAVDGDVDLACFVDPVAVPKPDEVKTSVTEEAPLDKVLEKTLNAKGLLHLVWHGILVITDE